eukprot:gene10605-22140_t
MTFDFNKVGRVKIKVEGYIDTVNMDICEDRHVNINANRRKLGLGLFKTLIATGNNMAQWSFAFPSSCLRSIIVCKLLRLDFDNRELLLCRTRAI